MSKYTTDIEYRKINSKLIIVGQMYQRDLKSQWVDAIVKNFDPLKVNPVKVSERSGRYYCFDGQHTLGALKKRNHGHDLMVDCMIYHGLTEYDDARLFEEQDEGVHGVGAVDKLRSKFTRGDPESVEMVRAAEMLGLIVALDHRCGPKRIVAVSKLRSIYKNTSLSEYTDILRMIRDAWGEYPDAFRREILGGMYLFYRAHKFDFDEDYLIKKLRAVTPDAIVREGNVSTAGGDRKYAQQILNLYNKNRSKRRLEDIR